MQQQQPHATDSAPARGNDYLITGDLKPIEYQKPQRQQRLQERYWPSADVARWRGGVRTAWRTTQRQAMAYRTASFRRLQVDCDADLTERLRQYALGPREQKLLLCGSSGSGKDFILWAIAREHFYNHQYTTPGDCLYWPELCHTTIAIYHAEYRKRIEQASTLIIADLRPPRSAMEHDLLSLIVDYRYRTARQLLMSTAVPNSDAGWDQLGQDFFRRIDEHGEFTNLPWTDWRV